MKGVVGFRLEGFGFRGIECRILLDKFATVSIRGLSGLGGSLRGLSSGLTGLIRALG